MESIQRKFYEKATCHAMAAEVLYLLDGTHLACGDAVNKFLNANLAVGVMHEDLLSGILVRDNAHLRTIVESAAWGNLNVSYGEFIRMLDRSAPIEEDVVKYSLRLAEVKYRLRGLFIEAYSRFYGTAEERSVTRDFRPGKLVVTRNDPERWPRLKQKYGAAAVIKDIVIDQACSSPLYGHYMVRSYAEEHRSTLVLLSEAAYNKLSDGVEISVLPEARDVENFDDYVGVAELASSPYWRVVPFHELDAKENGDVAS